MRSLGGGNATDRRQTRFRRPDVSPRKRRNADVGTAPLVPLQFSPLRFRNDPEPLPARF
ncbi:secreted protein of unknown function [Blastococcus saxobsidens DD2]|uniref:Uncharacterized protein n=1 Tax=Blastococcus saxobsidens (strain DD2) TaxID=1146883 RepID=H6RVE5_BLASD|nr:secreted protein of unknown function [Blastococcus saxobsidens DD2]